MIGLQYNYSRNCFVPGCKTGYRSDTKLRKERGENNHGLFKAPNDHELFEKWRRIIPRADKVLTEKDCVCAKHFPKEEISRFYETKLPDGTITYYSVGTIDRIVRGKPKLNVNAVPSIFPNLPFSFINSKKSKKASSERICNPKIKRRKYFLLEDNAASTSAEVPEDEVVITCKETFENVIKAEFSIFENLKKSLNILCMPYKLWSGTFIPGKNVVVFAEWDDSYITKKRILVFQDMSFKVLFGTSEIKLSGTYCITRINEIETVLKSVDNMKICSGIKIISPSPLCLGTVSLREPGQKVAPSVECSSCKMDRKDSVFQKPTYYCLDL